LHAYRLKLTERATDDYRHSSTVWAILAPHTKKVPDPPDLPAILKD